MHGIRAALRFANRVGRAFSWISPAIARLTVGLVFFQSGWGKLHDLDQVTSYFTDLGLAAPAFQARLVATTEFVCGGLLLLGLFTRYAAVPLMITMCVAIRTALWDQVEGLSSLVHLTEFAYLALLVWLATDGPGPLSLDRLITHGKGGTRARPAVGRARHLAGHILSARPIGRAAAPIIPACDAWRRDVHAAGRTVVVLA